MVTLRIPIYTVLPAVSQLDNKIERKKIIQRSRKNDVLRVDFEIMSEANLAILTVKNLEIN